jgi:hypothetical protein
MNAGKTSGTQCTNLKVEERTRQTWPEYIGLKKYAIAIYRLQEEADLTFKEARACLTPIQCVEGLAKEWGCSKENIYNLQRSGRRKVVEYTKGNGEETQRLMPRDICHVL